MAYIVSKNIFNDTFTPLLLAAVSPAMVASPRSWHSGCLCSLHYYFCWLFFILLTTLYWHDCQKSPVNIDFSRRAEKSGRSLRLAITYTKGIRCCSWGNTAGKLDGISPSFSFKKQNKPKHHHNNKSKTNQQTKKQQTNQYPANGYALLATQIYIS